MCDENEFVHLGQQLSARREQSEADEATLQNQVTEWSVSLRQGRSEHEALVGEIASLKARRSNIPLAQIKMRTSMCQALELAEDLIPFVGELLQVREEHRPWEGAIERVLHNFGLALLVPDEHYPAVAAWVDRTHLAGRLVYFRVRIGRQAEAADLHPQSLVKKSVSNPTHRSTPGWSENWVIASTMPVARHRNSSGVSYVPFRCRARSRGRGAP